MALKGRTSRTLLYITFLALDISLLTHLIAFYPLVGTPGIAREKQSYPAHAAVPDAGDGSMVVQGVYVDGTLDLRVVQQPEGDANYISPKNGELTQFAAVSQRGNIGLLAHNYLSGRAFSRLLLGQDVQIQYSNGETENFVITEILSYQALEPKSPYSSFQSLKNESEVLSVGQMFDRVYGGDHHLTFQTCIARDGVSSWGRLFVVAMPRLAVTGFQAGTLQTYVIFRP